VEGVVANYSKVHGGTNSRNMELTHFNEHG